MEIVVIWVVCVVVGFLVGGAKDRAISGVVWPLVLGPIGLLIVLALPNYKKHEQEQRSMILREEELRVQKEILRELQTQRLASQTTPPPSPSLPPLPAPSDKFEEFIPESLRPAMRRKR